MQPCNSRPRAVSKEAKNNFPQDVKNLLYRDIRVHNNSNY